MEPILKVQDVSKAFDQGSKTIQVLKNINLTIDQHRLLALRGRSGSGKTTLLNLIGALDKPTNGNIHFLDKPISQLTEKQCSEIRRLHIGFVFQSHGLVPLLTVEENIEFGLRISDIPRNEWKDRIDEAIHLVALTERTKHRPFELSGGEQQRLAIARAIAPKPPLLLADEPTAELDSKMAFRILHLFQELTKKDNMTILMTTHDPDIIEVLEDVYVLEDGKLAKDE